MSENHSGLAAQITAAWERRDALSPASKGADVDAIETALKLLDSGAARVATRADDGQWTTHQWLKQAVLLSFRTHANQQMTGAPQGASWWDKVPGKFEGWDDAAYSQAGFRAVPGAVARRGSFIAKNVVLMPSF